MAVANASATGNSAVPPRQFRRSSTATPQTFSSLLRKRSSLNLPDKFHITRRRDFNLSSRCSCNLEDGADCGGDGVGFYSSSSPCSSSSPSEDWDWNRWTRHFSEVEQAENYASVLKFQLEDAIEKEDFGEAAKLKTAIAETTSKDSIAEIMSELKSAIDEERYHDASRLCRNTGSGLIGWWVGYSKDLGDGTLVQITPGTGRFIGKCYSPRQLITTSPGTPLFEIFVVKDNEGYKMQVAFLKTVKGNSANSSSSTDKSTKGSSVVEDKNSSIIDVEKGEDKNIDLEEGTEEGIKSVINFLNEKIPELKFKVTRVDITTEDMIEDNLKQFIEEENENETNDKVNTEDSDNDNTDRASAQENGESIENAGDLDVKLYIGGVLHNREDSLAKDEYVRVPADIENVERDSFVLHIHEGYHDNNNDNTEEDSVSKDKVAALVSQGISELMPPEVANAFWSSDKVSPKVSKDIRELVKRAVSQAQKRNKLSEYTNFSRIVTYNGDLDPFDGLYVGSFGPHGPEVIQLRRKYGNWNTHKDDMSSDVDFFEYVEAVKLTGYMNLPAGQVAFRAKIGKANRITKGKLYSRELGVVASYKGQGRIGKFGIRDSKWVEGELLQLDGRTLGPYINGANLGFLYTVRKQQSVLVLFHRLKLPE
ncbi:Protein EXECUTER 2- chloroplastic [Striga hermonthica]|uniref:Protein EXECUTER 2- chloroplastic n=1 Tax=Striga hermonthica TaxID=68872 RepID=A0A9N7MW16_STRHE|nr:Protein EXECUTER 2- chloroplastic [Striga hermonthica]